MKKNEFIRRVIYRIKPEYKRLTIVPVEAAHSAEAGKSSLERVVELRAMGVRGPFIIYGFERIEEVRKLQYADIIDESAIYYIKLPASIENMTALLDVALKSDVEIQGHVNDRKAETIYTLQKIREFKHRCDNLWMSMQSQLNRYKTACKENRSFDTKRLINRSYVEQFFLDYKGMSELVLRIGLKKAVMIPLLFTDVIKTAKKLESGNRSTVFCEIVRDMADCINDVKTISEIMSSAKETKKNA